MQFLDELSGESVILHVCSKM